LDTSNSPSGRRIFPHAIKSHKKTETVASNTGAI
jgi:hypothetical protein